MQCECVNARALKQKFCIKSRFAGFCVCPVRSFTLKYDLKIYKAVKRIHFRSLLKKGPTLKELLNRVSQKIRGEK